ncbi:glycohydrolase toxin TNT-related protein [Kibdelosporangium phytohabitans]|uniref:glycohydrolase toxin TNT-related protein n=1 Tax=Kibdelosporangium phytohabitans TaxID=860235 RepID=UPI00178B1D87
MARHRKEDRHPDQRSGHAARSALNTTQGAGADAARRHWGTFVQPDTGHLTRLAKGCVSNADKLDHAADQIGQAKLAIVRELTPLAKNVDVAEHAAQAGDPTALLGLDTAIRGAAANLADLHSTLVTAVQPVSGVVMDTVEPLVNTNPGGAGQSLLTPVTGLADGAGKVVTDASAAVSPIVDSAAGAAQQVAGGQASPGVLPVAGGGHGPGVLSPIVDNVAGAVPPVVGSGHGPGVLPPVVDNVAGVVPPVVGGGHGPGVVPPVGVPGVAPPVVDPDQFGPGQFGPGHGGSAGSPGQFGPGHGGPAEPPGHAFPPGAGHSDPVTGPLPALVDAPTPPAGFPRPDHGVQIAGAAAVLDAPPPPPATQPPVQQAPAGIPAQATIGQPPAASPASPFVGGGAAVPPPQATASPVVPPPVAGAQPVVPPQQQSPQQQSPQQQGPRAPLPPAAVAVTAEPGRQQPPPPVAVPAAAPGKPEQDRDAVIALWLVRMFPIGHMPVAAARPSRQLPPPSAEFDYAAGMRFEPNDHPQSDLVDDTDALALAGGEEVVPGPSIPAGAVTRDHDPLAGQNERDWARRFVVREGSGRDTADTEYAWPPSELFPEGATAPGEPEVLEPGTLIDRFGAPDGRVFAEAGIPFAQRSLPPSYVHAEYRRYRVLRPLPVWRGVSAAWFGQTGGGVRYRTTHPALDLIALGYVAEEPAEQSVQETGNEG